jgi:hypothetical protein
MDSSHGRAAADLRHRGARGVELIDRSECGVQGIAVLGQ